MKYIFIFILCFFSLKVRAQEANKPLTAGDLLIDANRLNTQSAVLGVISAAGLAAGTFMLTSDNENINGMYGAGYAIGALAGVASIVAHFKAWQNIKQAGMLMNEKGIGLNSTKEGIGLTYRF